MKAYIKSLFSSILLASASTSFAVIDITSDTTLTYDTSGNFSATDNYEVSNNATFAIVYTGDVSTHAQMNNYGISVEAGSTFALDWSKGLDFVMKSPSASTETTFDIYGTFEKRGASIVNMVIADAAANNVVWNFYDGSKAQKASGAGNYSMEVRRGTGTINVFDGANVSITDINIGGRNDSNAINGTINVEGVMTVDAWLRLGNTALVGTNAGKAQLNVTNGGVLTTRDFGTNIGTGYTATTLIKGLNSQMTVTYAVTLNSVVDDRSSSKFTVFTGSNFKINNANGLTSNANSKVVFGLDENLQAAASKALLSIQKLTVNTANDEKTFSFDLTDLGSMTGMSEGDVFTLILFDSLSSVVLNGTAYDLASMASADIQNMFATFISFDFAGNNNWEAFNESNLSWEDNKLSLSLTYVPEPSTYAAIFGALAIAFAAYRRKK